jgi:putative transposase
MVRYRRNFVAGGTYFFTATLVDRKSHALVRHVDLLRAAFRATRRGHPFAIDAVVVLPDHLHIVMTLPQGDADYPSRWQLIKRRFTDAVAKAGVSIPRHANEEHALWQRRLWEHTIRDDRDFQRHVDDIYFNLVKHGLVARARDWPHSSFHRHGLLPEDWAADAPSDSADFGEPRLTPDFAPLNPGYALSPSLSAPLRPRILLRGSRHTGDHRAETPLEAAMPMLRPLALLFALALLCAPASAQDGKIDIQKFNHSDWTKGIFSEATTVTGIGNVKFIYLAGVGAEDENGPRGKIRNPGDFIEQCKYAYDKIKRVLAHHGGTLADAVKITTYLTDLRYRLDMGKCIGASWGGVTFPSHTLIGVAALAFPEMIVEVDVTAIVAAKR